MPTYLYECTCGNTYEMFHHIENRDDEVCPDCGFKPKRLIAMTGKPVVYEYFSENLNARVTGPKQKARLLKERNLPEVGNG